MTPKEILKASQMAYKQAGDNLIQSPVKANSGQQLDGRTGYTRTWETGNENDYLNPHAVAARQTAQNLGIGDLNAALTYKVSPKVVDTYNPNNKPFNMSREAMVRRINMIRRQQNIDNRISQSIAGVNNDQRRNTQSLSNGLQASR